MSNQLKIQKHQQIQELAFHKQPCEINGVQFYCHQSYYEGELLNGVDLRLKEVKGLSNRPTVIDYLQDSQELIFCATSNIIVYNTHKRNYHQLFSLNGEVLILKTHFEKMNNREYIVWVEKTTTQSEPQTKIVKKNLRQSTILKKSTLKKVRRQNSKPNIANLFKSFLSNSPVQESDHEIPNLKSYDSGYLNQRHSSKMNDRKVQFIQQTYNLKIFDYTKKQRILERKIELQKNQSIKDVFMFWNHYRIIGYIVQNSQTKLSYVHYENISKEKQIETENQKTFHLQKINPFESFQIDNHFQALTFNNELNNYIFIDENTLNVLKIKQNQVEEADLFHQFLKLQENTDIFGFSTKINSNNKVIKLEVEKQVSFEQPIISVALNDQFVAILTSNQIHFHSAFDMQSTIFIYKFEEWELARGQPSNIEFNKSVLMLTYKNSSAIHSYTVKNKLLVFTNSMTLQVNHCKQILKIYTNNVSSEIFCVILFYELQSKINNLGVNQIIQSLVEYVFKPAYIDIAVSFLTPSSKIEAKLLNITKQKFKKIHTCPWLSSYVIETEEKIQFKSWKQQFQHKKCISIHPTGIFLVICFKQTFKIFIITIEGLINTYRGDSVKQIQACSISPLGNHLAIASTNTIVIYDFYSCNKIQTISLPFGIVIQSMEFSQYHLIVTLRSKKLYIYDRVNEYKEIIAFNPKSFMNETKEQDLFSSLVSMAVNQVFNWASINCLFYDPILNFIIYSYKKTISFFNCSNQSLVLSLQFEPISCIYYNQNLATLFIGTQVGQIICFAWPNKPANLLNQKQKFKFHSSKVIDIKVSSDLKQLITIGDDQSICISSLTFVQNLKKLEGLELVQQLSGTIKICYDILSRKGCIQYTHSKLNDKLDTVKDYEDEVLNMNFILPEERVKQKQQMFSKINSNTQQLNYTTNQEYQEINRATNEAKEMVGKARQILEEFQNQRDREKANLKKQLYQQYIKRYNITENSEQQLTELRNRYTSEKQELKNNLRKQIQSCQKTQQKELSALKLQFQGNQKCITREDKRQIKEIQRQKQEFIMQNLYSLNQVINDLNNNNGVISCKNNNLEKQITDLKRKIEEHRYLLSRLETNTKKLKEDKYIYEGLKNQNKKLVQKQDKINLTEIEKRYVKQTQKLIEKDKEINVKLVNYDKQKNILIYLQKCVESIQGSIEELVQKILEQKKDGKDQDIKINNLKNAFTLISTHMVNKQKQRIINRNSFKNYMCKLEMILKDIVNLKSKDKIIELLQERQIIDKGQVQNQLKAIEEKDVLNKIIQEKGFHLKGQTKQKNSKINLLKNRISDFPQPKTYRKLNTEGGEMRDVTRWRYSPTKNYLQTVTTRDQGEKSKEIYFQLNTEQKQYERIKTEQIVYENTRKKFNLQNQDLIESYNNLAMENKKIMGTFKRSDLTNRQSKKENVKLDPTPTPFLLYLQKKSNIKAVKSIISARVYEV